MKKFGLLGEKLAHSFSPQIHAILADYEYKLYEKPPGEVESFLRDSGLDGLNITIPYKKTVMPFCDTLSESAKKIGSVNTIIRRPDGSLHGDNTDYYGFLFMLDKTEIAGKKALVLGSGGASLTVNAVLRDKGAGEIVTISRSGTDNYENIAKHSGARIIVNTTPVGMYPKNGISPVDLSLFRSCDAVFDVVYNPAKTELMLDAEDRGIPCVGGLVMLAAQAKKAAEIFADRYIRDSIIAEITEAISREIHNIVIIGMPGCGKSSVGKRLSEMTGRRFFDTDKIIEERAGKSIEDIFEHEGEDVFRQLETDILRELAAECGNIIATGGGIVKNPINRRLMRQNSIVIFIDRAIDDLPVKGRPLSISRGVKALYEERLPLYREWSDFTVVSGRSVSETAENIKERIIL